MLFVHANGFSSGCYLSIFKQLSKKYNIYALDVSGHGASEATLDFDNWDIFRDQLIALAKHEGVTNAIGLGHSLGGTTILRAAYKEHGLFSKVVVLDPVILGYLKVYFTLIFGNPLARLALKRRTSFKSRKIALKIFEKHPFYSQWHEDVIHDYVQYCFKEANDKIELCCSPEVEAKIFSTPGTRNLKEIYNSPVPVHVITPKKSGVCSKPLAKKISSKHKDSSFRFTEGGHLFPFQYPNQTVALINAALT